MRSISIFQNASNNTTTCTALGSIYLPSYWTALSLSLSLREFAVHFLITIINYETGIACSFVQMWIASSQMRSDKTHFIIESIWSHSAKGSFIYWGSHVDSLILKTTISQREVKGSANSFRCHGYLLTFKGDISWKSDFSQVLSAIIRSPVHLPTKETWKRLTQ